jgi:Zn-finger nucleic acid-binding protein
MREVEKAGVMIDICPDCKGVWLDRGELEKLQATAVGGRRDPRDFDEEEWYDDDDRGTRRGRHRRRGGLLDALGDLFE